MQQTQREPSKALNINAKTTSSYADASGNCARAGYGETCAKVILFGEHSVVYGYSAIALPLKNLRMRATVTGCDLSGDETFIPLNSDSRITLSCLDFNGKLSKVPPRFSSVRTAIHAALEFAGHVGDSLHVATESNFPPERGLGSSAASAGAVIRAILDYYKISASENEIFELTQSAERVAHGRPSGLDATATSASWPVRFSSGEFSRMEINMRAWLILADSGYKGMTRVTVDALRSRMDAQPDAVKNQLDELGAIANQAAEDLALGRAADMGARMTRAHRILADLGISTPQLDELVRTARDHCALGAKLTGGGGGGCVIALADTEDAAEQVSTALRAAGARGTWIVDLSAQA
ncbi:mevalonate kinase [Gardnerella sp. KA00603]|uniref:Mevalonate kinase n=1 Tax=Gardnerella vaginalis 1500E TaxID=698957 RepID=I4LZQ6_GARVA|nr:mevalonate kinase [Gardnerella vaginalis 1500E]